MKVLVDSSVWSLALRRKENQNKTLISELNDLISDFRVAIIGPIRQEVLSGISDPKTFNQLKSTLQAFADIELQSQHYEYAAELYNTCRKKGVQGSHTDFLICSVGILSNCQIFTTDKDFLQYQKLTDIQLFNPDS